jgi:hypothetical protein
MATTLGFCGMMLSLVCVSSGCSAADAPDELADMTTDALRWGGERKGEHDTILVSVSDGSILKFSATGKRQADVARGLSNPSGLALDRSRNVYVASVGDDTVRRFSENGRDLGVFASAGLGQPTNLAFDSRGSLFVVNNRDNSIRKFSAAGRDLGVFVSLLGRGCAAGLVFNRSGELLVADPCYSVVRKFSATGTDLGIFAASGLTNPLALLLKPDGNLLVANTGSTGEFSNTIHEFSPTGADLGTVASKGLNFPGGFAADSLGNLLVANEQQRPESFDYGIQKLASDGTDLGVFATLSAQPRSVAVASTQHCR